METNPNNHRNTYIDKAAILDPSDHTRKFRKRANRLRCNASGFLILIIVVLLGGIVMFLLAGALATSESGQVALLQDRIDAVYKSIADNRIEIISLERGIPKSNPSPESEARLSLARDRDQAYQEFLRKLQQQQLGTDKIELSTATSYGTLVSAIATRVGSIVLLLFLVRILVPQYRYNKRLSAYYDARADALELTRLNKQEGDKELELFEQLTPSLSPDHVDFSEAPSYPTQELLDLVKQVLTSKRG